jgi:hypothetical protein
MIAVVFLQISNQTGSYAAIKHCIPLGKSYEPNGYNLYNMAGNVSEWTDSSYDPNAYEYVSSMNPNVLDASNKRKVVRGVMEDVAYFLQVLQGISNMLILRSLSDLEPFRITWDYKRPETVKVKTDKTP